MEAPMARPSRGRAFWRRFSHALGGPRGLRWWEGALVTALVLGFVAVVVGAAPDWDTDPGPGWPKAESLPKAKPVWTEEIASDESVYLRDDILIRGDSGVVRVHDLATGEKLSSLGFENQRAWLSQDYLIGADSSLSESAVMYDLHDGEELRRFDFDDYATFTVASETLISIEDSDGDKARMTAFDLGSGKKKWSKDLEGSWADWDLDVPSTAMNDQMFESGGLTPESASPIVLLEPRDETESSAGDWESVIAVDVATGEQRWDSPIDYDDFTDPLDKGFQLTESGDIYVRIEDDADGEGERPVTGYIVNASTGKATGYPEPPETDYAASAAGPLCGDTLLTIDDGLPAIVDLPTGEVVWRAKKSDDQIVNGGELVLESVMYDPEDPGELDVEGVRAIDTESGKTLWTREGFLRSAFAVMGNEFVTQAFTKSEKKYPPIQVFDRDTGKGKWQVDATKLVAHSDDYFVFTNPERGDDAKLTVVSRDHPK